MRKRIVIAEETKINFKLEKAIEAMHDIKVICEELKTLPDKEATRNPATEVHTSIELMTFNLVNIHRQVSKDDPNGGTRDLQIKAQASS